MLRWEAESRFTLGGATFHALPPGAFVPDIPDADVLGPDEFAIFKPRSLVDRYAAAIGEIDPQRIVELGVLQGGSTVFFAELARAQRVVAVDRRLADRDRDRIESYAHRHGLAGVIRALDSVDQADREALAAIVDAEFDGASLDLVVDDCSHLYEETRASFNELFPRLRAGGLYVIEDWSWAHAPLGADEPPDLYSATTPLTRLLFELVLAIPAVPGLIEDLAIDELTVSARRGNAEVDRETFDIAACSNARGRALLAPG